MIVIDCCASFIQGLSISLTLLACVLRGVDAQQIAESHSERAVTRKIEEQVQTVRVHVRDAMREGRRRGDLAEVAESAGVDGCDDCPAAPGRRRTCAFGASFFADLSATILLATVCSLATVPHTDR